MKSLFINLNKFRKNYTKFPRKYSTENRNFPQTENIETEKSFSLIQFKRSLKISGYDFEDGFTSLKTVCPVCDSTASKDNQHTVFLNKITGQFICPKCQHVDSFSSVCDFFTGRKGTQMAKQKETFISRKPKLFETINLDENIKEWSKLSEEEKHLYLNSLGINIPIAAFNNVEALYDVANNELIFPMCNIENKVVGYKRLKKVNNEIEEQTIPEIGAHGLICTGGHKTQTIKSKESTVAVIVSNVLDLLAINTKKVHGTIVCLPQGSKSLPIECLPFLERFQKLILWFNHDVPGWETSKSFAKKLDEKRCFFVRPIDSQPSPYVALQQNLDIKQILAKSQAIIHKSITTFHSLRQDVLSDLQNIDKVQGVKWKRYPLLNKYLKGHRKGELTILTGPTGCGKTTFMSEYSLDLLMQGVTTLWGSFEIRNTRLASTLLRQMAGHPLDENITEFDFWADEFEKLPLYFMTFHGQQSIKIVMDAIEHAQYVHDINHVIIDNLQFMMGMTDEAKHIDRFWKQDAIIASFRTFATRKNCHVTLVIHPRKERDSEDLTTSSIFGSAKAAQEADNVLIIQDKRLTSIRGKKYLQIAKNRYSGDLGIMPLDFDKLGLSYAAKKKKVDEKSSTEVSSQVDPKE